MELHSGNISHIIQLAITPAFLLLGIGSFLRVLLNRLARIIDRLRVFDDAGDAPVQRLDEAEFEILLWRRRVINRAVSLAAGCALLVCTMIAVLFIDALLDLSLDNVIGILFVLAMLSLAGGFACFLHEIRIARTWLLITMGRSAARGSG